MKELKTYKIVWMFRDIVIWDELFYAQDFLEATKNVTLRTEKLNKVFDKIQLSQLRGPNKKAL